MSDYRENVSLAKVPAENKIGLYHYGHSGFYQMAKRVPFWSVPVCQVKFKAI